MNLSILALLAAVTVMPGQTPMPTGAVCGHVDAPMQQVVRLQLAFDPKNIIVARSATEVVQTSVHTDGSFCFDHLNTDIHTLSAFGDEPAPYRAIITPIAGETRYIEVERHSGE